MIVICYLILTVSGAIPFNVWVLAIFLLLSLK